MLDDVLSEDMYLQMVCNFLKENEKWYLKRFGYAACELWLCSEICNILNFDHELSFSKTDKDKFCFNEDSKRDLTIYKSVSKNRADILSHIEVKLLYPAYSLSKRVSMITELFSKLENVNNRRGDAGWFFIIWSSMNSGSYTASHSFFEDVFSEIKFWVERDGIDYSISANSMIDIFAGSFGWRGTNKDIIIKAIAINHK